jgi:hypothetical protein
MERLRLADASELVNIYMLTSIKSILYRNNRAETGAANISAFQLGNAIARC